MTRTYKPIGDGVLLKKLKMEDHTKGGILLPDMAQGDILKGKVVAIGDGMPDIPMFVEPGDIVLYYVKRELMIDDYVLVSQRDIYVIVEEKDCSCTGDMLTGKCCSSCDNEVCKTIMTPIPRLTPEPDKKIKPSKRIHPCTDGCTIL